MPYSVRTDVEALFGAENVKKWADLDGNGIEVDIDARVTKAIEYADGEIDDTLRGGRYAIPISGTVPVTVIQISARKAGIWLYHLRSAEDENSAIANHAEEVQLILAKILSGEMTLDLDEDTPVPEFIKDGEI